MRLRIVHGQTFGCCGVVEGLVGRDQRDRAKAIGLVAAIDLERGGKPHGVVGTQGVFAAQPLASSTSSGVSSMSTYRAARCCRKRRRIDDARRGVSVLPLRRRATAGDFDGGYVSEVDDRGGVFSGDAPHPRGAGFQNVALNQSAGIEKIGGGHLSAARE
jgi:hypothetical protein